MVDTILDARSAGVERLFALRGAISVRTARVADGRTPHPPAPRVLASWEKRAGTWLTLSLDRKNVVSKAAAAFGAPFAMRRATLQCARNLAAPGWRRAHPCHLQRLSLNSAQKSPLGGVPARRD
jgi:hypothetical protein